MPHNSISDLASSFIAKQEISAAFISSSVTSLKLTDLTGPVVGLGCVAAVAQNQSTHAVIGGGTDDCGEPGQRKEKRGGREKSGRGLQEGGGGSGGGGGGTEELRASAY